MVRRYIKGQGIIDNDGRTHRTGWRNTNNRVEHKVAEKYRWNLWLLRVARWKGMQMTNLMMDDITGDFNS